MSDGKMHGGHTISSLNKKSSPKGMNPPHRGNELMAHKLTNVNYSKLCGTDCGPKPGQGAGKKG